MDAWSTRLVPFLRALALGIIGLAVLIFFLQRRIAFPGVLRQPLRSDPVPPEDGEQIWLSTDFGRIEAWLFTAEGDEARPAVLFAHGNGELIDDWAREMRDLADRGVHALAVEFPGYGFSDGEPARSTIRATFAEAFDRLASRPDVDRARIVAWGRSMGGGAAGDLTRDRPVAALVLQSTYSSTMAVARSMLVPGFLVRDRFDNVDAVRSFDGPVLLMHGPTDDVVPFSHAERLARARPELQITRIDCAHNDCARIWPDIREEVVAFLRRESIVEG